MSASWPSFLPKGDNWRHSYLNSPFGQSKHQKGFWILNCISFARTKGLKSSLYQWNQYDEYIVVLLVSIWATVFVRHNQARARGGQGYKPVRDPTIRIRIRRCEKATNTHIQNVTFYRMRTQTFVTFLPRLQKSRVVVYHTVTRESCVHFLCLLTKRSRLSKRPVLNPILRTLAVMSINHVICLHASSVPKG